jgi:hypothetical protein
MRTATHVSSDAPLRRLLLAIVLLGTVGLLVELALLAHVEAVWQWIPLALLGVALAAELAVAVRRRAGAIRVLRAVMALCVAAGAVGVYLHYRGNAEFALERDGSLRGLHLFWEAVRGATPALAPAALSQLGLLGLAYTYRHPALGGTSPSPHSD